MSDNTVFMRHSGNHRNALLLVAARRVIVEDDIQLVYGAGIHVLQLHLPRPCDIDLQTCA